MENEPIVNETPVDNIPPDTNFIPDPNELSITTDDDLPIRYVPNSNEEVYGDTTTDIEEAQVTEAVESQETEPQETNEVIEDSEITSQIEKTEELFTELSDDNLNLLDLYETEYIKDGKYSDKTYEALKAKGWSKEHIDVVSDAVKIKVGEFADKLIEIGGGQNEYQAIQEWVKNGKAHQSEVDRYNEAVNKGDLAYAKLQLNAWKAESGQNKVSKPAATLQNIQAGTAKKQVQGFSSINEQVAAINDPRYMQGGSYQKDVQARMLASNIKFQPY